MANKGDRLAVRDEGFDQLDRVPVFGQILQRTVTAGVEDRVEVFLVDAVEAHRLCELRFGNLVSVEAPRHVGLQGWLITLRIERRLSALWRGEGDLGTVVLEDVVRRCEFFEPEAGFLAGVAESIVRSQYHEDFHYGTFRQIMPRPEASCRCFGLRSAAAACRRADNGASEYISEIYFFNYRYSFQLISE